MIDEQADDHGVDLWGDCGEFGLQPGWWGRMLAVAQQYGWKPQGTEPPIEDWEWDGDPAMWDGSYWPGVGQRVTHEDARGMAAALELACADIRQRDVLDEKGAPPQGEAHQNIQVPLGTSALEPMSREFKEVVGWFITHCRECGGFDIASYP